MLKSIIKAFEQKSLYRQTRAQLHNLSDRELYDIGINRASINSIAYAISLGKNWRETI
jgi:uncharacterized protein YjiS (DUF1127 family)